MTTTSNAIWELPGYTVLREPDLLFHPERMQDKHPHPLEGLVRFGPYSRVLLGQVTDPIRIATISPYGEGKVIDRLLRELEQRHVPRERKQYLIEFLGFSRIFGTRVVSGDTNTRVELGADFMALVDTSDQPHVVVAEALTRAIGQLQAVRDRFDVLVIYLPDAWQAAFYGQDDDFDLHDYLKAVTATRGIPIQIIRDNALTYQCRASVAWRLGIALYCKAGGIPWKLANSAPLRAYVGLSYALRQNVVSGSRFITCCSQIFDADGGGLEFIAYETDDVHVERENPFLSRAEMRRVMARTLALYQRRHGGQNPKEVVIHKTTEFKPDEVDGCFDAWPTVERLELIQIQMDVPWRGIHIDPPRGALTKGSPGRYPTERGIAVPLGGRELLLWTQGNAPTAVGGRDFFKEGKGIPAPLLLRRFAGHGSMFEAGRSVMELTKMDWNNDSLYDRLPVTISYAGVLARTLKRMPNLMGMEHQFRFFM